MRIRSVKPEFWRDEITGVMGAEVALFYLGLCSYCDDFGRFEWNPVLIRADIDAYDAKFGGVKGIERLLSSLERLGRIKRYAANGKTYGCMPTFGSHQKPKYPTPSKIPEPSAFLPQFSPNPPESSPEPLHGDGEVVGEGEGEGSRHTGASARVEAPAAPPAAPPTPARAEDETPGLTGAASSSAQPTTVERLRCALSVAIGCVGPGGKGLELGDSAKLGQIIRDTNAAVSRNGLGAVVEALKADAEQAKAKGRHPETLTFFARTLRGLADPQAVPPAQRVTAPASPPAKHTGGTLGF